MTSIRFLFFILWASVVFAQPTELVFPTDVNDVNKAIARLADGGTLKIKPGTYYLSEPIRIDKNVTMIGIGKSDEDCLFEGENVACLIVENGNVSVKNLILNVESKKDSMNAIAIANGNIELNECYITNRGAMGITIYGGKALISHCGIANCKKWGIRCSGGETKIERSRITHCEEDAVNVEAVCEMRSCTLSDSTRLLACSAGAKVAVQDCRFEKAKGNVISFSGDSGGTLENCEISGDSDDFANIWINDGSNPTFKRCRIFKGKGKSYGIFVENKGKGTFDDCSISGYEDTAIVTISEGDPTFRNCSIRDNKGGAAIFLTKKGLGTFENCRIFDNCGVMDIGIIEESNPIFKGCKIYKRNPDLDASTATLVVHMYSRAEEGGNGILVSSRSKGTFENCDISGYQFPEWFVAIRRNNGLSNDEANKHGPAITITAEADPVFRNCTIHGNRTAVWATENGRGTFEGNKLSNNRKDFDIDRTSRVNRSGGASQGGENQEPRSVPRRRVWRR